jgi:peptidoglycan/LPS O-acetylase OafA/YrhL
MKREIRPLTGFRGIAALTVVIYHFGQPPGEPQLGGYFHVPKGYLAVDAFFILSAFVLSYTYGETFRRAPTLPNWCDFLIKRWARIYPAYYAVLALAAIKLALLDGAALSTMSAEDWSGNIVMATGWGLDVRPLVGNSWSTSAELICYCCLPLVFHLPARQGPAIALAALMLAGAGLLFYERHVQGVAGPLDLPADLRSPFPMIRCACDFLIGLVLFHLYRMPGIRSVFHADGGLLLALACLGVSIVLDRDTLAVFSLAVLLLALAAEGRLARMRRSFFSGRSPTPSISSIRSSSAPCFAFTPVTWSHQTRPGHTGAFSSCIWASAFSPLMDFSSSSREAPAVLSSATTVAFGPAPHERAFVRGVPSPPLSLTFHG